MFGNFAVKRFPADAEFRGQLLPSPFAWQGTARGKSALMADPATDWSEVDIEALHQHLIDMDNVTLRALVPAEEIDGGARFLVTSDNPSVIASIRRMTVAHTATMNGVEGWALDATEIPGGAALVATGDALKIRALGFIGLMTVGMHHQSHHLRREEGGPAARRGAVALQFLDDLDQPGILEVTRQDHRLQRVRIVGKLVDRHRHDRTRPDSSAPGDRRQRNPG